MSEKQYTFIKSGKRLIKLNFDEISIIKGLGNYVEIITTGSKKLVYYKSLKDLIENLPEEFMRVHNSFIINLRNVDYFEDNHLIINDQKISVAKSYKECLQNSIENLLL
ncbi:LytTR family transcriptional regulator [Elizabethkingia anophelis]|uniref:Transcriptional regulator n=1 Tax=Elizabethkingia anophelis TaxID=1117645 RepID=A0AAE4P2W7_9FLAO|nr:LytTR family transcriptional regulator [Elizabethkingia anophelis]MCT3918247.1 LytTR family transcriptional regulator [Elizabethkingia anophelis]MCT3923355.1 LytTR family transcriptional regulator [Elizabethkingia anophelis]MCT3950590.1 LytTR family transcriptional regulator [Elizabethkingia anophelis]MCT3954133.1 LytTR family transcriptional regulator [Elizabethkingia anophelis]